MTLTKAIRSAPFRTTSVAIPRRTMTEKWLYLYGRLEYLSTVARLCLYGVSSSFMVDIEMFGELSLILCYGHEVMKIEETLCCLAEE
jgi:hypothetical protein